MLLQCPLNRLIFKCYDKKSHVFWYDLFLWKSMLILAHGLLLFLYQTIFYEQVLHHSSEARNKYAYGEKSFYTIIIGQIIKLHHLPSFNLDKIGRETICGIFIWFLVILCLSPTHIKLSIHICVLCLPLHRILVFEGQRYDFYNCCITFCAQYNKRHIVDAQEFQLVHVLSQVNQSKRRNSFFQHSLFNISLY